MAGAMLSTVKITPSHFPDVYEAILREWNPNRSRDQWQRAFDARWTSGEELCGYALADAGRIVGLSGMILSQRTLGARTARFCNLHCWYVKPDYRANSLTLIKPLTALKDHILTDFTPNATARAVLSRLGFTSLESTVVVLPPIPMSSNRARAEISDLEGLEDPHAGLLNTAERRIYEDHQGIDCGHLLIRVKQSSCYLVYSRISHYRLPYCLVHFVGNPQLFVDEHAAIRHYLIRRSRSSFLAVESRLLAGRSVPLTFRTRGQVKMCHAVGISPHEIDTLYSEMVLFKDSILPGLRQRLGSVKRGVSATLQRWSSVWS